MYWIRFADHVGESVGLRRWLSSEELGRADALRQDWHRDQFILSHAFKRRILADYLDLAPCDVPVIRLWTGKPVISPAAVEGREIGFSLSHSKRHAIVAVSTVPDVGVDVEEEREDIDVTGLATRYFAHEEVDVLLSLPLSAARRHFFRVWTAKEAFVKAVGLGLAYPLDEFAVGGEMATLRYVWIGGEGGPTSGWSLRTFIPEVACHVALAVRIANASVTIRRVGAIFSG